MIRPILTASAVFGLVLAGGSGVAAARTTTPQYADRCLYGLSLRVLCSLPVLGQVDKFTRTVPTFKTAADLTGGALDADTLKRLISAFPAPNVDTLTSLTRAFPGAHADLDEDDEADEYGD
ncbi:hypothetical protein ACIBHX_39175 [Nonomuraea sp. NPDC050536]|uniref:hypothetical protein n=1 Tax=Nonomuraea sp. NPDC050536 TaxID=3364366 RepID=UPI0037CAACDF